MKYEKEYLQIKEEMEQKEDPVKRFNVRFAFLQIFLIVTKLQSFQACVICIVDKCSCKWLKKENVSQYSECSTPH